MKKIPLVLALLCFLHSVFAQDSITTKLGQLITAYQTAGKFNGTALVAQHGKILLLKGYGLKDADNKTWDDENTQYQIASVTKTFTSAVVLKLVELKKMQLNDKLSKFYPGFLNGDSITIENLLTHTSGIHNFTESDSDIVETDEKRMVPYLKTLKPDFKPGTDWHYSNSGFVMLAFIIQKVTGLTYWQAVRKYVFQPLGMGSSGFDFAHLTSSNKAIGYDVLNDSVQQKANITDSTVPFGAGAIYSTVMDMYKWHQGLQAYKIIGKPLMEKAYTPFTLHNYGYGWQIDSIYGRREVSHSGSISGFGSNFARVPADDICIVLLSNKSGSTSNVMNITNKLLAILYNKPYTIPVKRVPVAITEDVLKKYTGTYKLTQPIEITLEVSIDNGMLIVQPYHNGAPGPTSAMKAISNKSFYAVRDEETETDFDVDDNGAVKGVTVVQPQGSRYAKKIK